MAPAKSQNDGTRRPNEPPPDSHSCRGCCRSRPRASPAGLVAGVTLAALAIPEVMGYTSIAGTPVVTGLYTILLPLAVSRCRLLAPPGRRRRLRHGGDPGGGPGGARVPGSPAVRGAREPGGTDRRRLVLILARVVGLAFLADFLSRSVLVGFLTGVGIQVAAAASWRACWGSRAAAGHD